MRIELQIAGLEALDRKLRDLPLKVAKKVVRSAVRRAQKITLAAIKASTLRLPISKRWLGLRAALIAGAWELRAPRRQRSGGYALHVQLLPSPALVHESKDGRRSYIPAAIEFGHGATKDKAARPYARPAAEKARPQVEQALAEDLGRGIEKAAMESP